MAGGTARTGKVEIPKFSARDRADDKTLVLSLLGQNFLRRILYFQKLLRAHNLRETPTRVPLLYAGAPVPGTTHVYRAGTPRTRVPANRLRLKYRNSAQRPSRRQSFWYSSFQTHRQFSRGATRSQLRETNAGASSVPRAPPPPPSTSPARRRPGASARPAPLEEGKRRRPPPPTQKDPFHWRGFESQTRRFPSPLFFWLPLGNRSSRCPEFKFERGQCLPAAASRVSTTRRARRWATCSTRCAAFATSRPGEGASRATTPRRTCARSASSSSRTARTRPTPRAEEFVMGVATSSRDG